MELYIQIRDGQPYEHPILGDNFREAFPHIDTTNLPPEFARFERVPNPELQKTFQVSEVSYQWVNGVVKDVWSIREMTAEERAQKTLQLANNIYKFVAMCREVAQKRINNNTGAVQEVWVQYLQKLDAWVLQDVENPKLPRMPQFLEDGTIVTTDTAGSAPNVIE